MSGFVRTCVACQMEVGFDPDFPDQVSEMRRMGEGPNDLLGQAARLARELEASGPACVCGPCARGLEHRFAITLTRAVGSFALTMARAAGLHLRELHDAARRMDLRAGSGREAVDPARRTRRARPEYEAVKLALRRIGRPAAYFEPIYQREGAEPFVVLSLERGGLIIEFTDHFGIVALDDCAWAGEFDPDGYPLTEVD